MRSMNNGWKRGINCPICGGLRKDCRQSLRTNLIHCRVLDAAPRDYIYLREDAEGFGMWQHRDDRSSWVKEQRQLSEEEREQKRLERLQLEKERERAEKEKYAQSLSVESRDREIRKILNQLFLWPSHEKALRDRFAVLGLELKECDRLIAEAGYKSVRQWQKLDQPVDERLPGVRLGGLSLLIPGDGILIPIKNESGLYIGLQVRLDNPLDGNKYPWLAGERKRANRPSSKLRNGELPLSLHLPKTKSIDPGSIVIGLAEGVGFKPQIAAERLGIPFVGASGGHFAKSPELLRNYLDFLISKYFVTKPENTSVEDIDLGEYIRNLNNNPPTNLDNTSARNIDEREYIRNLNEQAAKHFVTKSQETSVEDIDSEKSIRDLNNTCRWAEEDISAKDINEEKKIKDLNLKSEVRSRASVVSGTKLVQQTESGVRSQESGVSDTRLIQLDKTIENTNKPISTSLINENNSKTRKLLTPDSLTPDSDLTTESSLLTPPTIVLFADGGSPKNPTTLKIYSKTVELLESWGFKVKIGWWGQLEKSLGDIDEIATEKLSAIEYLSWSEFIGKVKREQFEVFKTKAIVERSVTQQQRLNKIAAKKSGVETGKINQKNAVKLYETHRLTYKIDHLINVPRLPDLLPLIPGYGILNLKSAKATGKSYQIKQLIKKARAEGRKVISITPRIALGREQAVNWEINWIDDNGYTYWVEIEEELSVETFRQKGLFNSDKVTFTKVKVTKKVAKKTHKISEAEALGLCWDSLHKIFSASWYSALIVIDEVEAGLKHLLTSSTLKAKRSMILAGLEEKIAENLKSNLGLLVLADADLSNISVDHFKSYYPETKITTIVNLHKAPSPWKVRLHVGSKSKDKVYRKLIKSLAKGKKIAIPVDSQKEARALEIKLNQLFPKKRIKVVDRKYTQTNEGKEFVENINTNLREENLDVLIYTPSLNMGISIDVKVFDLVIAFYYGVLEPAEIRQSLARYRLPVPRLVWCNPIGLFPDPCRLTNAKEIGSYIFKYNKEALEQLARYKKAKQLGRDPDDDEIIEALLEMRDVKKKEWLDIHLKTYCRIIARRNYGLHNLAPLLGHQLREEGHLVTLDRDVEDNGLSSSISEIKKELDEAYIAAFTNAKKIPLSEALERKKRAANLTEDQAIEMEKALLQDQLPGVDLNQFEFNKKLLSNKRKFLRANRLFWLYQNRDACIFYDNLKWSSAQNKYREFGLLYLPDIKAMLPMVELLEELGLFAAVPLNYFEFIYTKETAALIEFKQRAIAKKDRIKQNFGLSISEDIEPISLVNLFLSLVGLRLKGKRVRHRDGVRHYIYQLDRQRLEDSDRQLILNAIATKYQSDLFEYHRKNGTVPSVPINIETDGGEVGQIIESSLQDSVPPVANNIETDGGEVGQLDATDGGEVGQLDAVDKDLTSESQFILSLLNDLENQPTRGTRFKTTTQIEELLSIEFEQRIIAVEKEILSACPDFYSRWMNALVPLLEELPASVNSPESLEEHLCRIYDSPTAIEKIALMLIKVENTSDLQVLNQQEFYDRDRFNKAARLLPKNKQQQLRAIADELDRGLDSVACCYLERCQRVVGKTVKALVNNAGDIVSKLGKFIGLELINNRAMVRVMIDGISYYYKAEEFTFL